MFNCLDNDECTSGDDNCDAQATCTNNAGGFDCACNSGYTGDGVTCTGMYSSSFVTYMLLWSTHRLESVV